jgi:hypothetical protein
VDSARRLDLKTFLHVDQNVLAILRCPLCKCSLDQKDRHLLCTECASSWPLVDVAGGRTYDFRIQRPDYLVRRTEGAWLKYQKIQVNHDASHADRDSLDEYLSEIDSVKEIYENEFPISGSVLDVGGHQGRLRHYLSPNDRLLYVSVDPFIDVFLYAQRPNLLKAYPCLSDPCNFLACHAENLPFAAACFEWIHMRSVLDHFADAYLSLREAGSGRFKS